VLLLSSILTLAVCCKAIKFSHLHISLIPSPCFIPSTYNILQIRCWRNGDKLMYGIKQNQTNLVCIFQKVETFERHMTQSLFILFQKVGLFDFCGDHICELSNSPKKSCSHRDLNPGCRLITTTEWNCLMSVIIQ
jgi:hypothetical protein